MGKFVSTKVFDGYSTCFRQWMAEGTHCRFLHGYGISFKVWFKGELDHRNWVWDFGGMKRAKGHICFNDLKFSPLEFFKYLFDHTVIIAKDDPCLDHFLLMDGLGTMKVRVLDAVGAEKFAEYLHKKIYDFVHHETYGRVEVQKVEFREHKKNSATYEGSANENL